MKNFFRLLRYGLPYTLQWMPGVLLLAVVGALDALRLALFVPIIGVVLQPGKASRSLPLFPMAPPNWRFDVHEFVPPWMHNVWTVVAFALIASTVVKGICDYAGTYLVNYAGFATVTDLRNHLYANTLRRSSSFFHKHPTGSILSTLINDVDRVQIALSAMMGNFLQQFYFSGHRGAGHRPGRAAELGACAVCAGGDDLHAAHWALRADAHPHRPGQAR